MNDLRDTERQLSNLLHETTPEPPPSIDLHALARTAKTPSRRTNRDVVRRWAAPLIAAASVLGVIAGGAAVVVGGSTANNGPDSGRPTSAELQQAEKAIAHWRAAARANPVLTVIPTLQQVGEWEPGLAAKYADALAARSFAEPKVPKVPQPEADITWASGESRRAGVLSAFGTFRVMVSTPRSCHGCTQLAVTGAVRTTMQVRTTRGMAKVPAWRFSLAGTRVQVLHTALPVPNLRGIPQDPYSRTFFHQLGHAVVEADDRTITAEFTGGPAGDDVCSENYSASVVEVADAVVVIISTLPKNVRSASYSCTDEGHARSVEVVLRDGLGGRPVIQLRDGIPAPVVHK